MELAEIYAGLPNDKSRLQYEHLGQMRFNLGNWIKIATYAIPDDIVVGGLKKLTGKEIKENLNKAFKDEYQDFNDFIESIVK